MRCMLSKHYTEKMQILTLENGSCFIEWSIIRHMKPFLSCITIHLLTWGFLVTSLSYVLAKFQTRVWDRFAYSLTVLILNNVSFHLPSKFNLTVCFRVIKFTIAREK